MGDIRPEPHGVLMVCLGNICRSPLAQGIFEHRAAARGLGDHFLVDSAGTGGWHLGAPPDPRSVQVAEKNGIDITGQRARKVAARDFAAFHTIFAMDRSNLEDLLARAPGATRDRITLILGDDEVPDPYYGGPGGFDAVFAQLDRAISAWLDQYEARS